jgi:hypothetical protein
MKTWKQLMHKNESTTGRVIWGLAGLTTGLLLIRSIPDLVRYLRVKRM